MKDNDDSFVTPAHPGRTRHGVVCTPPFEGSINEEAMWSIKAALKNRRAAPRRLGGVFVRTAACTARGGFAGKLAAAPLAKLRERGMRLAAACISPGVSIAATAIAHGVSSNLARRWVLEAERRGGAALATAASSAVPTAFVAVQLPRAEAAPADIRIELRRGTTAISVSWPCAAASACAAWMRELLR